MASWDEHVGDYLRLRRQLGFTLAWDEHLLGQLTTHLDTVGASHLTTAVVIAEIHDDEAATTAVGVLRRAVAWFTARGVAVERVPQAYR